MRKELSKHRGILFRYVTYVRGQFEKCKNKSRTKKVPFMFTLSSRLATPDYHTEGTRAKTRPSCPDNDTPGEDT
jgi:hypothetical protein